ncbi:metal-dependent hydrolase [Hydrogenovibrio marinus]|uniref:Metal-dependent hydrolase n=1 Tax=Hydrogenovibrio marinus TaxID=28885 RepID=A0A066ZMK3_HYDMR|nr:metal-dependent hydrolase [Hydrogenovibrio marinus]KDN94702.1 hypothetical protein EI16_12460 [Hydrogenovibrio marinus]
MTRTSHLASGAILSAAAIIHYQLHSSLNIPFSWLVVFVIAIMAGATAPDWMEIPRFSKTFNRRVSMIPHRTITHWLLPWAFLFGYTFYKWTDPNNAITGYDPMLFVTLGFSMGALLHCILDWMTPEGIPVVAPFIFKNGSMYLVRKGFGEFVSMIILALITIMPATNGFFVEADSTLTHLTHKPVQTKTPQN